ncbi:calcium-binding protein [Azospirillum sp. ST 5-10]|uniref:calcium-binding protein n=1 Tax=unclassified Azospirillum TaxID=2630922 RepID=UPI003F49C03C
MVAYSHVFGTAGADRLIGTSPNQKLFGGPGDDYLQASATSETILVGGSGADTYTGTFGRVNAIFMETGNSANDRYVDFAVYSPATYIFTIDGRHLAMTNANATNNTIFIDWRQPANVIEYWDIGGQTLTHAQVVRAIEAAPGYLGDVSSSRLPGSLRDDFYDVIAETRSMASWMEDHATPVTVPPPAVSGTATALADDRTGGAGGDRIDGLGGDDTLVGLGGADSLYGGDGADALYGNQGGDRLFGDDGDDFLFGGQGNDVLTGGWGHDVLYGQLGDDSIAAGGDASTLFGGQGNDELVGGAGSDLLYGNLGIDWMSGGAGDDTFYGGGGADVVVTGDGADRIVADGGFVTVTDFRPVDGDRIVVASGAAIEVVADADGNAVIVVDGATSVTLAGVSPDAYFPDWVVAA